MLSWQWKQVMVIRTIIKSRARLKTKHTLPKEPRAMKLISKKTAAKTEVNHCCHCLEYAHECYTEAVEFKHSAKKIRDADIALGKAIDEYDAAQALLCELDESWK